MRFTIAFLSLVILFFSCKKEIQPISLHPANPHYFSYRGKPTVLITSGEHYGAVMNLDFDYIAYLDELHSKGLNLTRTFTGTYVEFPGWFGLTVDQPLSPAAGRLITPWERSSVPGYINGGNKFDLTRWDKAYFERLKDFVAQAGNRGIVVELTLFCPYYDSRISDDPDRLWHYSPFYSGNNVNGIGHVERAKALTLESDLLAVQEAYVRKLVSELKSCDNLIYEVCNEPYIESLVPEDWVQHMTKVIVEEETGFRYKHLISHNINNGSSKITDPNQHVSVFNFHYSNPSAVRLNYGLDKVIGNNETSAFHKPSIARMEAWAFIIGGGGLHNNLDMSFTAGDAKGGPPEGEQAVLRKQMTILKTFMDSLNFIQMKPSYSVVKGELPAGVSFFALAEPGQTFVVYLHTRQNETPAKGSIDLKLELPSGKFSYTCIDPKTGELQKEHLFEHQGGEKIVTLPAFDEDLALKIKRIP